MTTKDFWEIFKVFDDLEKEEMETFIEDFTTQNLELAHNLMTELEEKICWKINDLLETRRQEEICFFTVQNETKIKYRIIHSIRKVIATELLSNDFKDEKLNLF